ncbi:MAG: cation:proton antiporter [Pseudanabaenaceae cyanobacterium SKYGB_i_bin29]|nr:cation:proton antiporter [Pseudanabaenaceae cyanobacterium SKYG29]MDW8422636.1 cation:proton antiporter [Pseudanabaenaceae cyanobacterium SKYGB_i_bin29]
MQEDLRLIVDLVTVLTAAALGGLLAAFLRVPVILGYILGGILVGPTGLGLIKELVQVETLAQFGVAFLLFTLGVEFSLSRLQKVREIAVGGGLLQIFLTIGITTAIALGVRWVQTPLQGIFLGAILSLSSTAVVVRIWQELDEMESAHAQVSLGILIAQDLALGLMLVVLPALDQPTAVFKSLLEIALFAAGAIASGMWVIPPLLNWVASFNNREVFLLTVIVLCLGIALLTEALGLSIEVGAFVAGLMIAEVEYSVQTLTDIEPLRNVFAALFFAAVGMLIDPLFLWDNLDLILGLVAIVMVGKFLIVVPLVRWFGYPPQVAVIAGLSLAQIGEFSFVLASEGQKLGLVSRRVYLLIAGTTAVTLMLAPFLLKSRDFLFQGLQQVPAFARWLQQLDVPVAVNTPPNLQGHILVCGYGRVGQNIVNLLLSRQYPVVVIEQLASKVQMLRERHIPYVYGNCASPLVLEKAGIENARSLLIVTNDPISTRLCVENALKLAPNLDIVARAFKDSDIDLLYQLGAKEVVHPEFEASLELSTHILLVLGEPIEQVDKEIRQVRQSRYAEFRPEIACPVQLPEPPVLPVD